MNVVWKVCRIVAVTLLAAVLIGGALDATASDFVDGAVFVLRAGFVVGGTVAVALCVWIVAALFVDAWRESR